MCSQDRKYFRFRYRVIFVALLVISPATSSAPKHDSVSSFPGFLLRCAEVVSALIKDPNGFLKSPDKAMIEQVSLCIHDQRVRDISKMIEHTAKGPILSAGLLVVSGYLLYESTQLYERARDLKENLEKYDYDFKLVEDNYTIIKDYIKNDIEPNCKNGNTAKVVRNLEKVMKKLTSYFISLSELADHARKDIRQIEHEKSWCSACILTAIITCSCAIGNGNFQLIIPTCSVGVFTLFWGSKSYFSLQETLEKCQFRKEAIMEKRAEINKVRASLEVVMMRADISLTDV